MILKDMDKASNLLILIIYYLKLLPSAIPYY